MCVCCLSGVVDMKPKHLFEIFAHIRPFFSSILVLMVPIVANIACSNFISHSFSYTVVLLLKLAL